MQSFDVYHIKFQIIQIISKSLNFIDFLVPVVQKNPCEDHICGWGKECIVDKKGEAVCDCITKCPELDGDPYDQV